jgi:hypothetical protein
MPPSQADALARFQLRSLPAELWGIDRLCAELRADDPTIRRRVREGRLPGPCLRRGGRAYWAPGDVEPLLRSRRHRLVLEGKDRRV